MKRPPWHEQRRSESIGFRLNVIVPIFGVSEHDVTELVGRGEPRGSRRSVGELDHTAPRLPPDDRLRTARQFSTRHELKRARTEH